VLGTYKALLGVADQIIRAQGIDPTSIGRFGPLALNLQVQGAIALAAAERAGLAMDEAARQEIVKACEAVGKASNETLWGDTEARRCLVRRGRAETHRDWLPEIQEAIPGAVAGSVGSIHGMPARDPVHASDVSRWANEH